MFGAERNLSTSTLAFTRYCNCQYCVVYIAITGGRGGTLYCAIVRAVTVWSGVPKHRVGARIIVLICAQRPRHKTISCTGQTSTPSPAVPLAHRLSLGWRRRRRRRQSASAIYAYIWIMAPIHLPQPRSLAHRLSLSVAISLYICICKLYTHTYVIYPGLTITPSPAVPLAHRLSLGRCRRRRRRQSPCIVLSARFWGPTLCNHDCQSPYGML